MFPFLLCFIPCIYYNTYMFGCLIILNTNCSFLFAVVRFHVQVIPRRLRATYTLYLRVVLVVLLARSLCVCVVFVVVRADGCGAFVAGVNRRSLFAIALYVEREPCLSNLAWC